MRNRFAFVLLLLVLGASAQAEIVGPFGGDVRSIAIDPLQPEILLLGTSDGQIYRSTDGASHWHKVLPGIDTRGRGLVIDNIVFDPTHPGRVYIASWDLRSTTGGLFRSEDGGITWSTVPFQTPEGNNNTSIRAIAISPRNGDTIVLGTLDGVYRTRDAGQNWEKISRGHREYDDLIQIESVAIDPRDDDILYAGTWHLGYRTTDGGKNWTRIDKGMLSDSDVFSLQVDSANPETVFASACSGIYKSTNGGELWTKLRNGLAKNANRTRSFLISPRDSNVVFAGTTEGLYKSFDGGTNWIRMTQAGLTVNAIAVHPQNPDLIYLATDDSGVLKSGDAGKTFVASNLGFVHRHVAALAADPSNPDRFYAGVLYDNQQGGFYLSEDSGQTWRISNKGLLAGDTDVYDIVTSGDGAQIWLNTRRSVYVSTDRGASWTQTLRVATRKLFHVRSEGGKKFLAWTDAGLYQALLLNGPWKKVGELPIGATAMLPAAAQSGELWLVVGERIYRTTDRGVTWTEFLQTGISEIQQMVSYGERLLAATTHGLFLSTDEGKTWRRVREIPGVAITSIVLDPSRPGHIYAADQLLGQIYASSDGGASWRKIEGSDNARISALHVSSSQNVLLAATLAEGIHRIPLSELTGIPSRSGQR